MTFTVARLTGSRALVHGTDYTGAEGRTVLDTSQWDDIKGRGEYDTALATFDAKVEEFFLPITEAVDEFEAARKRAKENDPLTYVILDEGDEGRAARPESRVQLSHDSIVLRILEGNDHSRLVWVGDQLEVLEATVEIEDPPAEVEETAFTGETLRADA